MEPVNCCSPCPVCEATAFLSARFGLIRCENCGIVLNPAVWEPYTNQAMEDEWFGEGYTIPKTSAWVDWFESRNNRRTFDRIQEQAIEPGRMLEIGIGSGSWLGFMKQRVWEVLGVDLSKAVCNAAQSRWHVPTYCGGVETLPEMATYDLVVMNHVLEHVDEPIGMLSEVRRRMKPGGLLHLAVPNAGCWEATFSGWSSYEPYHLLYFTPDTLRQAVSRAGFQVERVSTHESFSGWFLTVLRCVLGHGGKSAQQRQTERHRRAAGAIQHVYRLGMVISGAATWPLRRLQERMGRGDEIIVIARA